MAARLQHRPLSVRLTLIAAVALVALTTSGCLRRSPGMTGSVNPNQTLEATEEAIRRQAEALGRRNAANPTDPAIAIAYASALRRLDQRPQAVAVLQQAAIRNPKHLDLLGAYGKALADVGRFKEAGEVLARAHLPERPNWRILSAQGTVADQMGEHETARQYYDAALKIAPGEPTILSNLGLSLALAQKLPEAERTLTQAASHPQADARVRQNLALVLGLQGKFEDAERLLRRDLSAEETAASLQAMRAMVSQQNSWAAIRDAEGVRPRRANTKPAAPAAPAPAKPAA